MTQNRRTFLGTIASLTAASLLPAPDVWAHHVMANKLHIASNEYSWITFYQRQGRDWFADLDVSLGEFTKSGIAGYEPSVKKAEDLHLLAPLLKKYNIEMRSIYVGCTLHKEKEAQESLEQVTAIAKAAQPMGVKIFVTNPSPIRWGGTESKTDAELKVQAEYLDRMGAELRKQGIILAYHNHDIAESAAKHLLAMLALRCRCKQSVMPWRPAQQHCICGRAASSLASIPLLWAKVNNLVPTAVFNVGAKSLLSFPVISLVYYQAHIMKAGNAPFVRRVGVFLIYFPLFLSVSMGLALHNTLAVWEGWSGRKSPFIRTPKFNLEGRPQAWQEKFYLNFKMPYTTYAEGLLGLFFLSWLAGA